MDDIPDWDKLFNSEQQESIKANKQASVSFILHNWMEVKNFISEYLKRQIKI